LNIIKYNQLSRPLLLGIGKAQEAKDGEIKPVWIENDKSTTKTDRTRDKRRARVDCMYEMGAARIRGEGCDSSGTWCKHDQGMNQTGWGAGGENGLHATRSLTIRQQKRRVGVLQSTFQSTSSVVRGQLDQKDASFH
jgi:hypothetical protein